MIGDLLMEIMSMEVLTTLVIVNLVLLVISLTLIAYQFKRIKSLTSLLKIALGEVNVSINMGDYIGKNKKKILEDSSN